MGTLTRISEITRCLQYRCSSTIKILNHLVPHCTFYHIQGLYLIFQMKQMIGYLHNLHSLSRSCTKYLKSEKRSSSTLALNKSGEGYEKSMFRTSSDGLLETPLQQHYRSLLLHINILEPLIGHDPIT